MSPQQGRIAAPVPRGVKRIYQPVAAAFWAATALSAGAGVFLDVGVLEILALALLTPITWLLVDVLSGVVHWALDTYGSPQTPLIGPVIGDFRHHHVDQSAILDKGFLECCGGAAVPALGVLALLDLAVWWTGSVVLLGVGIVFISGSVLTNYIHRHAHHPAPTPVMRALQRLRLVLPPAEHRRHHRGDHRRGYGITNGWSNPLLERLGAYRGAEIVLSTLRGPPADLSR